MMEENYVNDKKECKLFLESFFLNKEYLNVISFKPHNLCKLKKGIYRAILKANKVYKEEYNITSMHNVVNIQEFMFENKIHENLILDEILNILEKEQKAFAESMAGLYKGMIFNNKYFKER